MYYYLVCIVNNGISPSTLFFRTVLYPRDALLLLARYYLRSCVCLSVASRSFVKTAERIELILAYGPFSDLSYAVLKTPSTSFWNLSQTLDLEFFLSFATGLRPLSTYFDRRPSRVYHINRLALCSVYNAKGSCSASRGFFCGN